MYLTATEKHNYTHAHKNEQTNALLVAVLTNRGK